MPRSYGSILTATDHCTIWRMILKIETTDDEPDQHLATLNWDCRQPKDFYEGTSGRSFYQDYRFGAGRPISENYFRNHPITVEYDPSMKTVFLFIIGPLSASTTLFAPSPWQSEDQGRFSMD